MSEKRGSEPMSSQSSFGPCELVVIHQRFDPVSTGVADKVLQCSDPEMLTPP